MTRWHVPCFYPLSHAARNAPTNFRLMGDAPRQLDKTPPPGHLLRSGGGIIFRLIGFALYSLGTYRDRCAIHFADDALRRTRSYRNVAIARVRAATSCRRICAMRSCILPNPSGVGWSVFAYATAPIIPYYWFARAFFFTPHCAGRGFCAGISSPFAIMEDLHHGPGQQRIE
jgi:hypothetical protein